MIFKELREHEDFIKYKKAILTILSLFLIKFVFIPVIDMQNEWLDKISVNSRQIKSQESVNNAVEMLQTQLIETDLNTKKLKKHFVKYGKIELSQIEQLKKIQSLADQYALKIASHKWDTVPMNARLNKNTVTLVITGRGVDIQSFLGVMEEDEYLWSLESFELTNINVRGSYSDKYNLSLMISAMQLGGNI